MKSTALPDFHVVKTVKTNKNPPLLGQMPKRFWTWEAQPKGVANRNNAVNWIISHTDQVNHEKVNMKMDF